MLFNLYGTDPWLGLISVLFQLNGMGDDVDDAVMNDDQDSLGRQLLKSH